MRYSQGFFGKPAKNKTLASVIIAGGDRQWGRLAKGAEGQTEDDTNVWNMSSQVRWGTKYTINTVNHSVIENN